MKEQQGIDVACTAACKAGICPHKDKAPALAALLAETAVFDIEEIDRAKATTGGCSFFATRALLENATVIFCPYNYIFDAGIRAALDIDVKDSAIIIDEGHNLEDVCRCVHAAGKPVLSAYYTVLFLSGFPSAWVQIGCVIRGERASAQEDLLRDEGDAGSLPRPPEFARNAGAPFL